MRRPTVYAMFGLGILFATLPLGCGSDGAQGPAGVSGQPPGPAPIDASTASPATLAELKVVSRVTGVTIASPPVVTFTVKTDKGIPIVGLVPFWEDSNRFIRFTLTKLVPGFNGDPDTWVAYVRDETSGAPDYDTGASLVDNGDGSYQFTFKTDVTGVAGVPYEPTMTHRVAGQIGRYSTVPLEEQNLWLDFTPNGGPVALTRNIAVMSSCNECHDQLNFHGRRFEVEYCVQCHNPDLADGEGDFGFMIHRIHNAGKFTTLDGGISYDEVTYPQDVINCRKCHNGDDSTTSEADNWRTRPNMMACDGCHDVFNKNAKGLHTGGTQVNNARCTVCHSPEAIVTDHATPNATPNNPELLKGQRNIQYEMISAEVDATTNAVTVKFKITSDDTPIDLTNLPVEFTDGKGAALRYPSFLLAYAMEQGKIKNPVDYNNLGRAAGQPIGVGFDDMAPIQTTNPIGTLTFNAADGVMTATVTDTGSQFPKGSTLRAIALQGYLKQDLDQDGSSDVSLHTTSAVAAVKGDKVRREVVDTANCANCHEFFEGHGGNRVFSSGSANVCVFCHVPNLSSSGRTLDLNHPEDTQNLRDMIHGIHSSGFRTRAYKHVRNFRNAARIYDWSHVTFPRGASTSKCTLCHKEGTYQLPLAEGLLPTTVRTTSVPDGADPTKAAVSGARGTAPNKTDWVNLPMGSTCFYCHTSDAAWAHMEANGSQLSLPALGVNTNTNRSAATSIETCAICHGAGKKSDVKILHGLNR